MVQGRALPAFGAEGSYAVVSNGALIAMAEDRADESRSICVVGAAT
jgi:hypothetical protein